MHFAVSHNYDNNQQYAGNVVVVDDVVGGRVGIYGVVAITGDVDIIVEVADCC